MIEVLLVGLGGFIGAVSRYLVYLGFKHFSSHPFPLAILFVNTLGCFLIGVLSAVAENPAWNLNPKTVLFLSVGILGGFTTFSAFGLDTIQLVREQQYLHAVFYVVASVIFGLIAVIAGRAVI